MARASRIVWHVWQSIKPHWLGFFATFALFAATIGLGDVYAPTLVQRIIDGLSSGAAANAIFALFAIYVAIALGNQVIFRVFDYIMVTVEKRITKAMQDYAFARIFEHDHAFFVDSFAGSIVAKVKRYARGYERMHDLIVFQFVPAIVTIVGVTIVLLIKQPLIAWLFLGWFVLFLALTVALTPRRVRLDLTRAAEDSRVTGALADALTNALTILTFAHVPREHRRFEERTAEQERAVGRSGYYNNLIIAVQSGLITILELVSIYVAIQLFFSGEISIGTVVLVQTYVFMMFANVWRLGRAFSNLLQSGTDMAEMVDLMDAAVTVSDPARPERARISRGGIVFDRVDFSYGGEPVFKELDLRIEPGERVGIVGTSGAGKSTLTKLLLRFMDVTGGSVSIDGQDVRHVRLDDLRRAIAYVPQEPILFHRTLEDNIRYGAPGASKRQVHEAASKAHAAEFIERLPDDYATLVGERGIKLSGGERQRVAIARAMLKDAPILVLDEATSSLDAESEKLIQAAFEEASKGRTTIVIAHRLATVKQLDRIIVLEEGRIVEEGTHAQLLRRRGRYYELYTHQRL